jgi:tRNA nucleotidyltransferase (CCA-adding enzyme)
MPDEVKFIINELQQKGYKAYIVGGSVRDSVLGKVPKDWDVTTNCKPEEVISIFKSLGYEVIETGLKHGTVTVMINKVGFEITTFRIDGEYSDHRHSDEVIFVEDVTKDLARRDFTINAMAYNDQEGLIDPFGGLDDIKGRNIKCVGDAIERFTEDALRMLRAARFIAQLNFILDTDVMMAMTKKADTLKFVSKERIRDELCKILVAKEAVRGLYVISYLGLVPYVIPQLEKCIGFDQNNSHHDKNVYDHIMSVIDNSPARLDVRLAALLHDIGKPECYTVDEKGEGHFYKHHMISMDIANEVLKDLRFDNNTINKVAILVKEHMSRYEHLRTPNIKKFINRVGIENLEDLFDLQIADIKGSTKRSEDFEDINNLKEQCYKILNEKQPLTVKDLAINGKDLIAIGYKPGVELGNKLKELMELVLEEIEPNEKERLLELSRI